MLRLSQWFGSKYLQGGKITVDYQMRLGSLYNGSLIDIGIRYRLDHGRMSMTRPSIGYFFRYTTNTYIFTFYSFPPLHYIQCKCFDSNCMYVLCKLNQCTYDFRAFYIFYMSN